MRSRHARSTTVTDHRIARHQGYVMPLLVEYHLSVHELAVPFQRNVRSAFALDVPVRTCVECEAAPSRVHKLIMHGPPIAVKVAGDAPAQSRVHQWLSRVFLA